MTKILVDSASDYGIKEIHKRNLEFVPISITIGENNYTDGVDFEKDEFYELLVSGCDFPKTSQPSPEAFLSFFRDAKDHGDSIICILLSSSLSGTFQSAAIAKDIVEYDNIYLIDSLTASCTIRLLADHAIRLVNEVLCAEEIADKIEELKRRVKLLAGLDTLEYLAKGGRLSKSAAAIGELANIKPVITLTEEGTVGVLGKCIGKNKAISQVLKHLEEETLDPDFPIYTIYSYGTENCEKFEEKLSENGYDISDRLQVGATIGAHIGPNAFGIVFVTA